MIVSYYYQGPDTEPWKFEETTLDRLNLLVGGSGSGKTKFLNTLFNFASTVVHGSPPRIGIWRLSVTTEEYEYHWEYTGEGRGPATTAEFQVIRETLKRRPIAQLTDFKVLIDRNLDDFIFNESKLPRLERDKLSVTLLKEEEAIRPLYDIFAKVQRRNFFSQGLEDAISVAALSPEVIQKADREGFEGLWKGEYPLNVKLYLLKNSAHSTYKTAIETFKGVFATILDCDVQQMKNPPVRLDARGIIPAFVVKEKGVSKWIPLHELSSGMQKVLLIVTDILTLPKGSIYIIDEYENSLGINAIDFLPQFLNDHGENTQFFITTHHPYLINSMPMRTWKVFRRVGSDVSIKSGEVFEKKYGKSKQRAFIQLINDPFYLGTEQ